MILKLDKVCFKKLNFWKGDLQNEGLSEHDGGLVRQSPFTWGTEGLVLLCRSLSTLLFKRLECSHSYLKVPF